MMPDFEAHVGKAFMDNFPVPLGRRSTPEEQAYPLIFLNSRAASFLTGENLITDGGTMGAIMTGNIDPAIFAGAGSGPKRQPGQQRTSSTERVPNRVPNRSEEEPVMGIMDGIRVVEVASWTYVPIAGAVLAEWGADVIKIEHPETVIPSGASPPWAWSPRARRAWPT